VRVLVTGASGFVGHAACRELIARGHDVRALVRRPGSEPAGTAAVAGDLTDAGALASAVRAAAPEGVLHLAAEIASQRSADRVREVNVEGMRRLLEACVADGAPKVVFTSTVVTGEAGGALLVEDEPLPVQTPYGRSKQEGEALLLGCGLPAVVVRPGHVYGPGGWYEHEMLARLRQPGRFAVIGRGDNLWDVIHVDDVARALVDALERAPAGEIYHAADDEPIAYYDFMALSAQALGVGPPRRVPAWVARLAAGSSAVTAVVRSARTSNAKLKRDLGWAPRYPSARDGIPATVAALRAAG
jgi:nucleoside-diphosphate-sugar epimerase